MAAMIDAKLELTRRGDAIQLTPVRRAGRMFSIVDGFAVLDPVDGTSITDADVQSWRDADQR